ncbi:MAG TPA: hydrogenase maturation protease [Kofleriaceae bacterium]|nr:hydrogenase maturation protease [Kofleriaceae bacterium]
MTAIDPIRKIADAVLLEGYVLYPYRASAIKNRFRFPFGVLAPRAWSEATGTERWQLGATWLIEPDSGAVPRLKIQLRFLCAARHERPGGVWDQGDLREIEAACDVLAPPSGAPGHPGREIPFATGAGDPQPIRGAITVCAHAHDAATPLLAARVTVANRTPWARPHASRDEILPSSLLATHMIATVTGGRFVSLFDPPPFARTAAAACKPEGLYSVLAGDPGARDAILAAPIILYDHPRIAPESPGDMFDATEIDELLCLRALTLTDAEKSEVRATDPRAAAILDRVENLSPEAWERLHGARREPPAPAAVFAPGTRVRLRPHRRTTDAQDLLYDGCTAMVEELIEDVDGRTFLAVTLDDDPGRDLRRARRQYLHYGPYEVELCEPCPRILVCGVGNVFFGDDGFGVEVAARLARETWPPGVIIRDFGIRGLHLAYELCNPTDRVIVIDVVRRHGRPGTIYVLEPDIDAAGDSPPAAHGMDLGAVFSTVRTLGGQVPPLVIVGCEPAELGEGMTLSDAVRDALAPAVAAVRKLIFQPTGARCGALCQESPP